MKIFIEESKMKYMKKEMESKRQIAVRLWSAENLKWCSTFSIIGRIEEEVIFRSLSIHKKPRKEFERKNKLYNILY